RSNQEKLANTSLDRYERDAARSKLAVYQDQDALLRRGVELLSEFERLEQRRSEEAKSTAVQVSQRWSAQHALAAGSSLARKIWDTELYVAEETIIAEGKTIVRPRSVTIGKLLLALIILVVGTLVLRQLKRPLHWVAIHRFRFDESTALLYVRLHTYLLFIGLLVGALIFVNIPLAIFAFFGGALAIGIGFGAQNLINNFISGLILMFDRSIRLGDVIELDSHRGRVTAIGMRNSRVKRFDGIEMLVPNSQFLQQNVINWTLSDKQVRYVVTVGVAYGSPTRESANLILKSVEAQKEVLTNPQAYVTFDSFSESSLNFSAYFWLELSVETNTLEICSDIRHRIAEMLGEAGIEIPFPQRDLHLSTSRPLEVIISGSEK
ncbi:MAG TPA: mechanosensitive ion channel domain-containing protein, partial [Geobacteraceae bacterium]|nr:mechanosensitive ion channel domain-containing protein [Geobacteraceae bacterium]